MVETGFSVKFENHFDFEGFIDITNKEKACSNKINEKGDSFWPEFFLSYPYDFLIFLSWVPSLFDVLFFTVVSTLFMVIRYQGQICSISLQRLCALSLMEGVLVSFMSIGFE